VLALSFTLPATAEAESRPSICKSKKKKAAKKKRTAKKPGKAKLTALSISKLQKKKVPEDQIVEQATAAGYRVTKAEKKKLLKYKVKKPLIARLESIGKAAPVAGASPATKAPPSFDLEKTIDPNDIDFDSVPPPKGMPDDLAKKQRNEAEAEKKPAPAKQPLKSDDKKEKRVVIAAGK
jgi:hypothetical protein